MSRIFAAVAVSTILLIGAGAIGIANEEADVQSDQMDSIVELFSSTLDLASFVPIVLLIGVALATVGVFARL